MTVSAIEGMTDIIAPPADLTEVPVAELLAHNHLDGEGPVAQQVYRLLHRLIVNLRLLPNQFLSVNDVAECLNTSKTPIRETFIRLAEDGLVQIVPKKGTFVAPIDIQKAFEGYFVRISLESACAEMIARTGSDQDFAVLREELAKQRRCLDHRDNDAFYILDNQFHGVTFLVAGLPGTKRMVDAAKAEVDRIKGLKSIYRFCRDEEVLYEEHAAIVAAIASRDGERATYEIHRHLTGMNEAIQALAKEEKLWGMVKSINQRSKAAKWV